MAFIGGLRKHMLVTRTTFLRGILSLCGILLLACFWSKDEILAQNSMYFPVIGWIAWIIAKLSAFYRLHIYFITFKANSFKESFLV